MSRKTEDRILMTKLLLTSGLAGLVAWQTKAGIVDFDVLGENMLVPNGYGGLNWDNLYSLDGVNVGNNYGPGFLNTGYHTGVVSPNNVAYNGFGNPAIISGLPGESFDLTSGYLTAAWANGLHVKATGRRGGTTLYDNTFAVNPTEPVLINFGYRDVDMVILSSYGSTPQHVGQGYQFVIDSLKVSIASTTPVPEPSQVAFSTIVLWVALGMRQWKQKI